MSSEEPSPFTRAKRNWKYTHEDREALLKAAQKVNSLTGFAHYKALRAFQEKYDPMRRYFRLTWKRVAIMAGVDPQKIRIATNPFPSRRAVIQMMTEINERGEPLDRLYIKSKHRKLFVSIIKFWGRYNNFCEEAEIDPDRPPFENKAEKKSKKK